jgi:ferredoxin
LTWSHATVVSTTVKYLEKLESLQTCGSCSQPLFRVRRQGPVEVRSAGSIDRFSPRECDGVKDAVSAVATFRARREPWVVPGAAGDAPVDADGGEMAKVRLAVDVRDCIGCDVCVTHCTAGVLRMVEGKALVDLRKVNDCDLDGECVSVCPTGVVSLTVSARGVGSRVG